jgi:hypothetical protein
MRKDRGGNPDPFCFFLRTDPFSTLGCFFPLNPLPSTLTPLFVLQPQRQ